MTTLYRLKEPILDLLAGGREWFFAQDTAFQVLAVAAAPVAVATALLAGIEIAVAAGVATLGLAMVAAVGSADGVSLPIVDLDEESATDFKDSDGCSLGRGIIYASHPKSPKIVIATGQFQAVILREQQADLVDYIRSIVPAKSIKIRMRTIGSAALGGNFLSSLFASGHSKEWETMTTLSYPKPEVASGVRDLIWMERFPSVVAGLRKSERGSAQFLERMQQNANLEASVAARAGFSREALEAYELEIFVTW